MSFELRPREAAKIVLLSVIEGEHKPPKYPGIFHRASLMILTMIDLLPHVEFSPGWLQWLNVLQHKVQQEAAAASF